MQTAMYQALLDPRASSPEGLTTWNGSDPAIRFAVYRNNVMASLIEALAENCPVLVMQLGDEYFRAMAAEFIRQQPPSSPVLAGYGAALPAWIESFPPLVQWPWLADLARLELLFLVSLHAAEGHVQDNLALSEQSEPAMAVVALDPSVNTFASPYAVFSLWASHQQDNTEPEPVDPFQAEQILMFRVGDDVRIAPISLAESAFIGALKNGFRLAEAMMVATALDISFEPGPQLARLHQHNLILSLIRKEEKLYGVC